MKILYATTNQAKFSVMKRTVAPLDIQLIALNALDCLIPKVEECGSTPLENAQLKAKAYYQAFYMPVFSCDSGLYFDEVSDSEQPGVYVRRVQGRELNDEEMIQHYSSLAGRYGGSLTARYRNAICLILNEQAVYCSMDLSLATEPFLLVSQPHPKRVAGFPLDSLSKDMASGKYYYDLEGRELSSQALKQGFRQFFAKAMENVRE
jgi:Xanthosine triphosphate pyrophosphatase